MECGLTVYLYSVSLSLKFTYLNPVDTEQCVAFCSRNLIFTHIHTPLATPGRNSGLRYIVMLTAGAGIRGRLAIGTFGTNPDGPAVPRWAGGTEVGWSRVPG